MATAAGRVSLDQFAEYAATHGPCELIDGEIRDLTPAGYRHGKIVGRLHHFLSQHVYAEDLGEVLGAETGFLLDRRGPTVRAADVAFVAKDRLPEEEPVRFGEFAPDLCVEVLSPDDRASGVRDKIERWLAFGVKVVWEVDPETRTVTSHQPDGTAHTYHQADTLSAAGILPGFELPLNRLFQ